MLTIILREKDSCRLKELEALICILFGYTLTLHVTICRKQNEDVRVCCAKKHVNLSINISHKCVCVSVCTKLMSFQNDDGSITWHFMSEIDKIEMKNFRHSCNSNMATRTFLNDESLSFVCVCVLILNDWR